MAVNKVVLGNSVKIDLSGDTVNAASVLKGTTFHDPQGVVRTGTYDPDSEFVAFLDIRTSNPGLFGRQVTITKV